MSATAIRARGIGKRYLLGSGGTSAFRYKTIRDAISEVVYRPFRRFGRPGSPSGGEDFIWALKDMSFEVKHGEVVGIIGRNGSGKSTLLKILSRITEPTEGSVELHGRVASLLEVGTGFHPELTGRENIYLNGAILGMKRREIEDKFDAMVAFAEVERFIDTPVKRFSSGMYLRLAFAVAAHLEHNILLVDEVLAVGDTSFQKKCMNKMQEVGASGRTVFFVSHNMLAVTRLCERILLLDRGRLLADGPSAQVIGEYLRSGTGTHVLREWPDPARAPGNEIARLRCVRVHDEEGNVMPVLDIRKPLGITMEYDVLVPGIVLVPNLHFFNDGGVNLFVAHDCDLAWRKKPRLAGRYASTAWVPGNLFAEGTIFVGAALSTHDPVVVHFYERDVIAFQIVDSPDGDSARGDYGGHMPGVMRPLLKWTTKMS